MMVEALREFCLSFDGVEERNPFGRFAARFDSILVFYVCRHMFCLFDMDNLSGVTVRNTPERIAELLASGRSCGSHRNMSARYWIELTTGADIPDEEVFRMIRESYEIVKAKYTTKKQRR